MAVWLLLVIAPQVASEPPTAAYFVNVDFAVINRVRSYSVEYDAWDRPRVVPSDAWWVSFWDVHWVPAPCGPLRCWPAGVIDRGWWTLTSMRTMVGCSGGWLIESTDGINVIAGSVVYLIDSDFDWEMRHRRLFVPIRKP